MPSITGYEPGTQLPPEMENVPITQPVSQPNQFGGGVVGQPTNPDPSIALAAKARLEAARAKAHADLEAFNQAHPGLAGTTGTHPVEAASPIPVAGADTVSAPSTVEGSAQSQAPVIPPLPEHQSTSGSSVPVSKQTAKPAASVDPVSGLQTSATAVTKAEGEHAAAMATTGETDQAALGLEREEREKQARDLKTQSALQAMDRQEADSAVQRARDEASKKKFTGIFRNEDGTKNWGRIISGGIAQILGSLSFDANHVNSVTTQIDNAIKEKLQQQEAEKADLWKNVQSAMDQKQALTHDQLREMADFRAGQAATLDAVILKGKELSALSKNKEGVKAVEANNARLGFERDKAVEEARRLQQSAIEKKRVDDSEISKNYAAAAHSRAAANTENTTAGQIKIDKFLDQMFKPGESLVQGTARSPGPIARRESARAIIKGIDEAVASKDPERIKAAIASAREQSSRILTGAAPTSQSMHLVTEMQGLMSKAEGAISSLAGSPTEGKQFVRSIHKLVEGIERENTEQIDAAGKIAHAKFKSTNAYKNPSMREQGEARIRAVYGEPAPEIPQGWTQVGTSGGKPVYKSPDGKLHAAQ
jgi:hypothetical protein